MKAWAKLTEQGRVGRLRKLAQVALTQYDLEVTKIKLLTVATNTIFRVECADGQKYALRISTPGEHTLQDALCEVKWLGILSAETDLPIPTAHSESGGQSDYPLCLPECARRAPLYALQLDPRAAD